MARLLRPYGLAGLALAASLTLAGCTREGFGVATAGRTGFGTALGYNVQVFAGGDRRPLPRLEGPALKGNGRISSAFVRGHLAVINVWGSWCGPCRREEPILRSLWIRYGPRGVRFLGVDVRDSRPNALAFVDEFDIGYPSLFDPASVAAFKLHVTFAPVTYLIDARGRIAAKILGAIRSEEGMARLIERELETVR